ncbi:MAG: hypothetical protein OXG13_14310 [Gemmatimonadaceae bacterium]|nr:hypothetical protein [Gemmatimonadaceae bacterium]
MSPWIDRWAPGIPRPVSCIAVIQRSDDDDDKLIVVPHGREYTDEQILALTEFQERFFESSVTREAGS